MRKIKITALLCLTVLLGSCTHGEIIRDGNVTEDEAAMISVSLTGARMGSGAKTKGLTEAEEEKINNIHVMVFDMNGAIVTNIHFDSYAGGLKVPTYSGNDRTIYVFANGDAHTDIDKDLGKVTKLSDLDNIKVENGLHDLHRTKGLLMYGKAVADIHPGVSTAIPAIKLSHLSVKVTLKIVDNTPADQSVQILGWDVVDVPVKGYLNERTGDDGVDINTSSDFFSTDGKYPFETINDIEKSATQSVYLFANRRGGRENKALPTDASKRYPGMAVNDRDHRGKAWYAPKRATYIQIYAIHRTVTGTEQVAAKIYLGEDNNSNYDIVRGNHYTFTVTVNGLDDINIDSNVDHVSGGMSVDHGTNLVMDAHPDFRPIRILASKGFATIEILDENNNAYGDPKFSATWLKVSPLNLMHHQVKQVGTGGDWQQPGDVGDFVRGKYIPHKTVRATLADKGGWNSIPSGKEDDDSMAFDDATYRMCYKITDIPFTNAALSTAQILCVYADEYISDMEGTRAAKVKVTYFKGATEQEAKVFTITQRGPMTIFDMNSADAGLARLNSDGSPSAGVKYKFVIEQFEEATMTMNPGIDLSVQNTNSMQWGFNGVDLYSGLDKFRNGYFLTAQSVYMDVTRSDNEPIGFGSSLRSKYGNGRTGGSGVIPNYGGGSHSGAPYYYPTATNNIYHPIYKSSAARYCHEKNRDINGDGIIDASETKWYLPSQHELVMLWLGNADLLPDGFYWSATQGNVLRGPTISWTMNLRFGEMDGFSDKTFSRRVRCVREL